MMRGPQLLALLFCLIATSNSINRPAVKVVLTQKGFAQFLQYDVETPPMREFTLCAWIRLNDITGDQSVFSYVGSGRSRIIRVWVGSRGRRLWVSFDGRVHSSADVEITPDAWRHVCLSYQSDYGAWALYIDSRLVFCKASQKLLGFIIPGGGSLLLGYGTSEKGSPNGLEGEIFGAAMILYSTIERNHTLKIDPRYEQKTFRKNQIKDKNKQDNMYIVLGDLQTEEIRSNLHKTPVANSINKTRKFIQFTTPPSYLDLSSSFNEEDTDKFKPNEKGGAVSFWSLVNKNEKRKVKIEPTQSEIRDTARVFQYETPPSVTAPKTDYSDKGLQSQADTVLVKYNDNKMLMGQTYDALSELEKPPPPEEKPQVYGQWTNSMFAGNVLKYLKSINFNKNKDTKKVPSTIPLVTIFDSFPYASEYKHTKIRAPLEFNRKRYSRNHHVLKKRDLNKPQINLQVIASDLRSEIIKSHSETQPKLVEVTNRGESTHNGDHRYYRHAQGYIGSLDLVEPSQITPHLVKSQQFYVPPSSQNNQKVLSNLERHRGSNFMTILPFLKSAEYFVNDENNKTKINLIDPEKFANINKRHNVISSSNYDFIPRSIDSEADGKSSVEVKLPENTKIHPSIKFKYNFNDNKLVHMSKDVTIEKGRALAEEVSNQANGNQNELSILKYNHGFLPGHERKLKSSYKINTFSTVSNKLSTSNFNKNVKLGNALNEKFSIGTDEKQSFIGGNDEIPDIYRYRSELDGSTDNIPPSLGPKVCKNIEFYDRVMYVQPDGSIDLTHIFSPVREKNLGIEFIIQNYRRCSMQDSTLEKSPYLLIDWSKTPVKLFGGAHPKKTKDLCGFF